MLIIGIGVGTNKRDIGLHSHTDTVEIPGNYNSNIIYRRVESSQVG